MSQQIAEILAVEEGPEQKSVRKQKKPVTTGSEVSEEESWNNLVSMLAPLPLKHKVVLLRVVSAHLDNISGKKYINLYKVLVDAGAPPKSAVFRTLTDGSLILLREVNGQKQFVPAGDERMRSVLLQDIRGTGGHALPLYPHCGQLLCLNCPSDVEGPEVCPRFFDRMLWLTERHMVRTGLPTFIDFSNPLIARLEPLSAAALLFVWAAIVSHKPAFALNVRSAGLLDLFTMRPPSELSDGECLPREPAKLAAAVIAVVMRRVHGPQWQLPPRSSQPRLPRQHAAKDFEAWLVLAGSAQSCHSALAQWGTSRVAPWFAADMPTVLRGHCGVEDEKSATTDDKPLPPGANEHLKAAETKELVLLYWIACAEMVLGRELLYVMEKCGMAAAFILHPLLEPCKVEEQDAVRVPVPAAVPSLRALRHAIESTLRERPVVPSA